MLSITNKMDIHNKNNSIKYYFLLLLGGTKVRVVSMLVFQRLLKEIEEKNPSGNSQSTILKQYRTHAYWEEAILLSES